MTTTESLNKKPIFYNSQQECLLSQKNRIQSNDKYPNFYQSIFTAGDEEQFQTYRDETNGDICENSINIDNNIYKTEIPDSLDWEGYDNIPANSVLHTFRYLFNKFKKGIFVKIKNNKLDVFLPFSNANFVNEWSNHIKIDPKYSSLNDFIKHVYELEGKSHLFRPKNINQFISTWFSNNCLVRFDFPINEGDHSIAQMNDMFNELCKKRTIPDIEFFINRRDFPLLKKDFTEPYHHMYDSNDLPLLSHKYNKYSPLFSFSSKENFADIPIPTANDWSRISSFENKFFFNQQCGEFSEEFDIPWKDKIPTAIFRGATTGCGTTIETNPRLKAAYLSYITSPDPDGLPLLDAGITKWKVRPRKLYGEKYLTTIDHTKFPFGLSNILSYKEQSAYKYIINIDGYVKAYRLSIELSMGCVILMVDSPYKLWFSSLLKPGFHYIPVKRDLSDLVDKIRWCRDHDKECEIIASNAKIFYETYLLKKGVLDYLQNLLVKTKDKIGTYLYNFLPFEIAQMNKEMEMLNKFYPEKPPPSNTIYSIPPHPKSHSLLQGIEWAINYKLNQGVLPFQLNPVNDDEYEGIFADVPLLSITSEKSELYKIIHKIFIGKNGPNLILKEIPNFQYTFGSYTYNNKLYGIYESFNCKTLEDYILSPKFLLKDYLYMIAQISLILQVSQNVCSFIHGNLTPKNVLLQYFPEERNLDYVLGIGKVIRIKTRFMPIIINYENSSIIHNNVFYGYDSYGSMFDILTLIYSSINLIIKKKIQEFDIFLYLSNVYTDIMKIPAFKNSFIIKEFIKNYHGEILKVPNIPPISIFEYITKKVKFPIEMDKQSHYLMNIGNSNQVYNYLFSKSINEKINSYLEIYDNIKKCPIPQSNNKLYTYYIAQSLYNNVKSVYMLSKQFSKYNDISNSPIKGNINSSYKDVVNYISSVYSLKLEGINTEIKFSFDKGCIKEQNKEIYENPEKILSLEMKIQDFYIQHNQDNISLADSKEIFITIFNNKTIYSLKDKDYKFYYENLKKLFDYDTFTLRQINSPVETIKTFSKEIYTYNVEKLKEMKNCKTKERYLNLYIKILDLIK